MVPQFTALTLGPNSRGRYTKKLSGLPYPQIILQNNLSCKQCIICHLYCNIKPILTKTATASYPRTGVQYQPRTGNPHLRRYYEGRQRRTGGDAGKHRRRAPRAGLGAIGTSVSVNKNMGVVCWFRFSESSTPPPFLMNGYKSPNVKPELFSQALIVCAHFLPKIVSVYTPNVS